MKFRTSRFDRLIDLRCVAGFISLALFTSCATQPKPVASPQREAAAKNLAEARSSTKPPESRAALYLEAAAAAAPKLGSGTERTAARETYNEAAAELTILLRSAENGRLWNHPLTLSAPDETYHLRLQRADFGTWAPNYFTSFRLADTIKETRVRAPNRTDGIGGELVGVRTLVPREPFSPFIGVTAPVTATLDFQGKDVTLALRRPARQPAAMIEGKVRPLAANYSAPLLSYKAINETLVGLMAALHGSHYASKTGLYFLQPYDPERIPLIFVHGLISTPEMWLNVINDLQADPVLRERYQYWIFGYPTGNPIAYSALELREQLAKVDKLYPKHRDYVFVSHSLGGLLSQMQATTLTGADWERTVGAPAREILSTLPTDSPVYHALIFRANPRVKRIVFICTPHRGSKMATSALGEIGTRLITLPRSFGTAINSSMGHELKEIRGLSRHPNAVSGLAPDNPTLKVMDTVPVQAAYHSIIGDRGKPGPLADSTDGVVPYWSSHMDKAQSELIVPGPHGSCQLPQTIEELKRLLRLHLKTVAN